MRCAGRTVAHHASGQGLAPGRSPRPYLHPVRTLAGLAVTETAPADHPHHLGAGVAVPDVDGHNFWGGRTFVRGLGPTERDNHGVQAHRAFARSEPGGFTEDLDWSAAGRVLLRERRTVTAARLTDDAWALDLTFALTNPGAADVTLGSPATNGRPGAGYGGFFWRAPKEARPPAVFTADREGEDAVHGRPADWLALSGDGWTLVFAAATEETRRDPWFVRAGQYPGVGSSLAAAARLRIAPGATAVRRVVTVVADGRADRTRAAGLASRAVTG
nr:PmoA family protein [Streptomyces sp. SID5785]